MGNNSRVLRGSSHRFADCEWARILWSSPVSSVDVLSVVGFPELGIFPIMTSPPEIRIQHLFISPGHNYFGRYGRVPGEHPVLEVPEVRCIAGRGIEGDRFFDFKPNYKGQITFFAEEVYEQLCAEFQVWDLPPSVFRRNVITRGAKLSGLIGEEFAIQGVHFLGTAECAPCEWMDTAFAAGAELRMRGDGGLRAKILSDGVLRVDGVQREIVSTPFRLSEKENGFHP